MRSLATHEIISAQAASIARSCARFAVRRIRRTPSRINAEYDGGNWARIYRERDWERAASLEAFLVGTGKHSLTARVQNRACRIPQADYHRYHITAMTGLVERSLGGTTDLVELGCGYGFNLFALSLAFPERRFVGLDVSPTGVAAGKAIAAHFGLQNRVEFDTIDLTDPRHPNYSRLKGRAALTHYCLEQLPTEIGNALESICAAKPSRVMHVEPAAELLSLWRPADWASLLYVRSQHYQATLLQHLRRMKGERKVEVIRIERMPFTHTLQLSGLLAVWRPAAAEDHQG